MSYPLFDRDGNTKPESRKKRMSRHAADIKLKSIISRAEMINSDPKLFYRVDKLLVFGSYLGENDLLGDLDIAFSLILDRSFSIEEKNIIFNNQKNWIQSKYYGANQWGYDNTKKILKGRDSYIHMTPIAHVLELECKTKIVFDRANQSRIIDHGDDDKNTSQRIPHTDRYA